MLEAEEHAAVFDQVCAASQSCTFYSVPRTSRQSKQAAIAQAPHPCNQPKPFLMNTSVTRCQRHNDRKRRIRRHKDFPINASLFPFLRATRLKVRFRLKILHLSPPPHHGAPITRLRRGRKIPIPERTRRHICDSFRLLWMLSIIPHRALEIPPIVPCRDVILFRPFRL